MWSWKGLREPRNQTIAGCKKRLSITGRRAFRVFYLCFLFTLVRPRGGAARRRAKTNPSIHPFYTPPRLLLHRLIYDSRGCHAAGVLQIDVWGSFLGSSYEKKVAE
ncbi:hypothetical protein CIHG_06885 [Coccidioides immitis H538.4]|uniref:Uncharacterized protein n=3 Tax=Coccidioides immitis TaxID=5501 RepID=A0A0J8TUM1_COCIT|nr:hypothetical protein CIRG_04439 [Coccidioides immitis RMSCC 2394]KMU77522.1 hypothetical protein CISG_06524 [Coccidioides immitis RMSCC 3703]KMU89083.1 hypothetical protein CIHG_06885 [Coccidioides immitis H538.4]